MTSKPTNQQLRTMINQQDIDNLSVMIDELNDHRASVRKMLKIETTAYLLQVEEHLSEVIDRLMDERYENQLWIKCMGSN